MAVPLYARSPRLLVLGAGSAQFPFLAAASRRGVWTAVVDRDPGAPGFQFADRRCIFPIDDEPAIERLAMALDLDAVVAPSCDWPVAIAARVAHKLGLPHPISPTSAVLSTNKLRQRERFAEAGIPHPSWEVAGDDTPPALPLLVRPSDRHGQKGCSVVADESMLASAIELARVTARSGTVILEAYSPGTEVTAIGMSVSGLYCELAVVDFLGAEVEPASGNLAAGQACQAVAALGITDGLTFTQLRLTPDGPEVLEVAAGAGGDDLDLIAGATGIDFSALALSAALGERLRPATPQAQPRAA